ncbi:NAD(P)H-dependent flavin oxidoreductase [Oceanobacillus senegalensis]|uniref:NAD(P)H-dependent flavin oxidoreductase n=1 Tax=Oceanobacillus senegalensis TaxID=1936063 RepID=UPI000A30A786|nr:nitronate monooxygenase [Oceanobacillus senegalensis]
MGNRVTDILNIKYPIIQGGMGNISDPNLASAISEAGGLGTIGVGTIPVEEVRLKIETMVKNTDQPCCVNIPISVHPDTEQVVKEVIKYKVPVVSLSAGNPSTLIPLFHEHDIKVICVTASVRQAKKAEKAGADIVVCEGYEAAGINALNESTTMTLVPQIVKELSVPVIAAGGIADGKGLAAALSLGAQGVQMGTRFVATNEAGFHPTYKKAILDASDEATMIIGRRFQKIRRVMKGEYAAILLELENGDMNLEEFMEKTDEDYHEIGAKKGNMKNGFINGGQIAGLIDDCPSVADLMKSIVKEAKEVLEISVRQL